MIKVKCSLCGEHVDSIMFRKHSKRCPDCIKAKKAEYRKTKEGVTSDMYSNQIHNSKIRGFGEPNYNLDELREFVYSNENFNSLMTIWRSNNFEREYKPSLDRIDPYKGYRFDNLRLVTFQDNMNNEWGQRVEGVNNKISACVIGVNIETGIETEYYSISNAARMVKCSRPNISQVLSGKRRSAGKCFWRYK